MRPHTIQTHAALALATVVALVAPARAASTEVNTCGQTVAGDAHLAADLDCTGFAGDAVSLLGGTFDLAGFTLTGGQDDAVVCSATCAVTSSSPGGTITGSQGDGIENGGAEAALTVEDIAISGNGANGVHAGPFVAVVRLSRVIVDANGADGVQSLAERVFVVDSTLSDNGGAGLADGNGVSKVVSVVGSTVTGNAEEGVTAVGAATILRDSDVMDNGLAGSFAGVRGGVAGLRILRSTVEGSTGDGVVLGSGSGGQIVQDSVVTANGGLGLAGIGKIKVKSTTISQNVGGGIGGPQLHKAILTEVNVTDNGGTGVAVDEKAKAVRSTVSGHTRGIELVSSTNRNGKLILLETTVTDNAREGLYAEDGLRTVRMLVKRSNVTANGTDPICGIAPVICADVVSESERPRFQLVPGTYECQRSYVLGTAFLPCGDCPPGLFPGLSFGICLEDCGNGILNGAEVCDPGGETAACDANCTPSSCGDSTPNDSAGEDCDDGNVSPNDACKNDCSFNVCGDGVLQTGIEECDDGNAANGDGCDVSCEVEP
jgi:cysteine-rich repeat protein